MQRKAPNRAHPPALRLLTAHGTVGKNGPSGRSVKNNPRNKGFLNRRFKRVFAYFCLAAKVGAESGGAQPPGPILRPAGRNQHNNMKIPPLPREVLIKY